MSSMQQALFKCETPRLKLKSSQTFLAIKRCEGTTIGKVIKHLRSSKLRWSHICAHSCIPVNETSKAQSLSDYITPDSGTQGLAQSHVLNCLHITCIAYNGFLRGTSSCAEKCSIGHWNVTHNSGIIRVAIDFLRSEETIANPMYLVCEL